MKPDPVDTEIIALLKQHARRTNRDIAQRLGLAESTVAARIRRLEETAIVLGYHARVRTDDTQLIIWAAVELLDATRRSAAAAYLKLQPETSIVEEVFGDFDIVFRAECKDQRHWALFEAQLLATLAPFGRLRGGITVSGT